MKSISRKLFVVAGFAALWISTGAMAGTEICMALDGSGSVGSTNFGILKEGTASAVEDPGTVPQNGSVTLSVVQFASNAVLEVGPYNISSKAVADTAAAEIRAITYSGGLTNCSAAINLCTAQFAFGQGDTQVIDLVTDGVCDGSAGTAADNAVAAGVDAINGMGVGSGVDVAALESLVRPQPSNNLGEGPGFVVLVPTFQDFPPAIAAKISEEVNTKVMMPVPTLSQWAMILMALLLAGMAITRLGRARLQ